MDDQTDPRTSTRTWSRGQTTMVIAAILVMFVVAGGVYFLMSGIIPSENTVFEQPAAAAGGPAPGRTPP